MCLVLRLVLTRTRNQKSRPLSNLFQCNKSSRGLGFAEWVRVEKHIFRGNYYYTILRAISISVLLGLNFEILTYPRDLFRRVKFNFYLQILFWLTVKKKKKLTILDSFALRTWKPYFRIREQLWGYGKHRKNYIRRRNPITLLITVLRTFGW